MGSSGKKKTTMAKHARENRLRERRLNKQAKRDARKQTSSDLPDAQGVPPEGGIDRAISGTGSLLDLTGPAEQDPPPEPGPARGDLEA